MHIRARYIFKTLVFMFAEFFLFFFKRNEIKQKTLLIIRTDAIGDYLLFRNFIEIIKTSERYRGYHITLFGNQLWKNLAEGLDNEFVDDFVFIDVRKFKSSWAYRKGLLLKIFYTGFETVVYSNSSREYLSGDSIARSTKAKEIIGSASNISNDLWLFHKVTSAFYTQLVNNIHPDFEFDRNKVFFEELLKTKLKIESPYINITHTKELTITLFPGAGEKARQWGEQNFAKVADDLAIKYPEYRIQICGGPTDMKLAQNIMGYCSIAKPIDLTGKTSLIELVSLISATKILLTNESSALHIGACTQTETIALMTGKHYKRFSPYSVDLANLHFVYPLPKEFYDKMYAAHGAVAFDDVVSNINDIEPVQIIQLCDRILNENPTAR